MLIYMYRQWKIVGTTGVKCTVHGTLSLDCISKVSFSFILVDSQKCINIMVFITISTTCLWFSVYKSISD